MRGKITISAGQYLVIITLICLVPSCNSFQGWPPEKKQVLIKTKKITNPYKQSEITFMVRAAEDYVQGIHMGQLAIAKAKSEQLRKLAIEIQIERKASLEELKQIAARNLVIIPTEVQFEDLQLCNDLKKVNGQEFDKIFCTRMEMQQRKTISEFENNLVILKDDDLKKWVRTHLPDLKLQLTTAIKVRKQTEKIN